MSAFGGKADIKLIGPEGPFFANNGHWAGWLRRINYFYGGGI
jgi:hypothetical protein